LDVIHASGTCSCGRFSVELFDQLADVAADGARVDAVVVPQVLDGQLDEEVAEAAQLVQVHRHV
jgi:uncharacterized protein YunC (DUF1805 family)